MDISVFRQRWAKRILTQKKAKMRQECFLRSSSLNALGDLAGIILGSTLAPSRES